MVMKVSKEMIKDIAEELDSGMKVYLNLKNPEIKPILDFDEMLGDDDIWENEIENIEREWQEYIIIEKMDSGEAFRVMEQFTDEVDDERLRSDLIKILNRRSPFANFKAEIRESSYLQKWYDFKQARYEDYVRDFLEMNDIDYEK